VTGTFGLLGALLATLGVYGLISYIVIQRSREMAIRRAIGASTGHIVGLVVGSSAKLTGAGLVVGVALGTVTAPLFGGRLVNVSPRDPFTLYSCSSGLLGDPAVLGAQRWRCFLIHFQDEPRLSPTFTTASTDASISAFAIIKTQRSR